MRKEVIQVLRLDNLFSYWLDLNYGIGEDTNISDKDLRTLHGEFLMEVKYK